MNRRRLLLIACPLVAILLYLPALQHDFVFDDRGVIVQNPLMQDLGSLPRVVTSPYWSGGGREAGLYRPLTSLTFAVDRAIAGGMKPGWFHLVNVLLHGAATLLVTLLALEILPGLIPAAVAGMLFAVHPVHVEAVAGIVGRAEILAACGVLLCLLWHRRAWRAPTWRSTVLPMAAAWTAAFLALMAKESAIVAPFLCVVGDVSCPAGPAPPPRRRLMQYAGYVGAAGLAFLLRFLVLGTPGPAGSIPFVDNPAAAAGPLAGRLTALGAVARYARLLLWPARLSADYSFDQIPIIRTLLDPLAVTGVLLVGLTLVAAGVLLRRFPPGSFALLFIAIAAAPTSNLIVFIGTLLAERLMYLPSAGVCLLVGCLLAGVRRPLPARLLLGVALLAVGLGAARVRVRLPEWRDDLALYRSAAVVSPRSARIRYNLGNAYLRLERYPEAETNYRTALSIYPDFNGARVNLGMSLLHQNRPREAIAFLKSAAEHSPDHADIAVDLGSAYRALGDHERAESEFLRALEIEPRSARAWNNLGAIDLARGDAASAIEKLEKAVRLDPESAIYRVNLADALVAAGRDPEAIEQFEAAHRIDPDLPDARRGLGEVALMRGDRATAEREFRRALAGHPPSARAANFLGYLVALRGDARGAAALYERALEIDPSLHDAHRSLGLLYAQTLGDPERAARHLGASLEMAPQQPDAERLRALLRDLQR